MKFTEVEYDAMRKLKKFYFKQIKDADAGLLELREKCDHPETEFCTYSTRPGQYWDDTEICSICGEVVNWPHDNWRVISKEEEENNLERDGSHVHIKGKFRKLSSLFKTSGTK